MFGLCEIGKKAHFDHYIVAEKPCAVGFNKKDFFACMCVCAM